MSKVRVKVVTKREIHLREWVCGVSGGEGEITKCERKFTDWGEGCENICAVGCQKLATKTEKTDNK